MVREDPEKRDRVGFLARLFSRRNISYLQASLERHKILLRLSRSISEVKELKFLLRLIASETSGALHADRATVFLFDKTNYELWSIFAEGELREIRFPAGLGIAGTVFTSGQLINITDAYKDSRWNPEIDLKTGYRTQSMLTVPMKNKKGEIIGVFQVLNKTRGPFNRDDEELLLAIASQAAVSVENALLMDARRRMFESLLNALADTIDMRDPTTAGHSMKVMEYSVAIAKRMGLSEQMLLVIRYAAYFHDYGKIAVRDAVLHKPNGLSKEEMKHIREHVIVSKRILERIDFEEELSDVPKIAALHHERLDGSGYPQGLTEEQIPLGARIIAVADVFDAITSKRSYRQPMSRKKAFAFLDERSGKEFDAEVVRVLKEIVEEGTGRALL